MFDRMDPKQIIENKNKNMKFNEKSVNVRTTKCPIFQI